MNNRVLVLIFICFWSCSSNDIETPETLKSYMELNNYLEENEVIACAASDKNNSNLTYVFYYPIPTATDIKYFEIENNILNKNDYGLYKPVKLEKELVFNGYLERFVKEDNKETWCVVTYKSMGKLYASNPIRLKNKSTPTEWTDKVSIDKKEPLMPKFSWKDGGVKENAIYFEVITNSKNDLLSGTYTYDKWFQYYKLNNVVLNVTRVTPPNLILNNEYKYTMMGVSEDNWVNLVIQKNFIAN